MSLYNKIPLTLSTLCLFAQFITCKVHHPIVMQISPPRSGSTAVMRSFENHPGFAVIHEPMLKPYCKLFFPEFTKNWFKDNTTLTTYSEAKKLIFETAEKKMVFTKDGAFDAHPLLAIDDSFLMNEHIHYLLLIRNPYDSLLSLYRQSPSTLNFPSVYDHERMWPIYQLIKKNVPKNRYRIVIAEKLFTNPHHELQKIYHHFHIPFHENALSWQAKPEDFDPTAWHETKWDHYVDSWHGAAIKSSGFKQLETTLHHDFHEINDEDKEKFKEIYENALIYYSLFVQEAEAQDVDES